MVIVPDLVTAATKEDGTIDLGLWKSVQLALINHCEGQANRMAVLDAPPGMSPQQIKEWRSDIAMYDSPVRGAVLPVDQGRRTRPPRTATPRSWCRRPVTWPASGPAPTTPAACGRHRPTRSCAARSTSRSNITKAEQGLLNPIGINCIRPFGTRGIRVWGARTLVVEHRLDVHQRAPAVQHDRDDDHERHPVRRVRAERHEAVGGPEAHRQRVPPRAVARRRAVRRHRRAGVLRQVRRARRTRPTRSTRVSVVVEVGIAPVKPAEFVIFRIAQIKETSA